MTNNLNKRSRRYVAPISVLKNYNVQQIVFNENDGTFSITNQDIKQVSANEESQGLTVVGINIFGWEICTFISSIANESEIDNLNAELEKLAHYRGDSNPNALIDGEDIINKRRLCLPEITFIQSSISVKNKATPQDCVEFFELKFTAHDALCEWAECHSHLQFPNQQHQQHDDQLQPSSSYKGVSIIQTVDAELWAESQRLQFQSYQFKYDWTFSSPYAGSVYISQLKDSSDITTILQPHSVWKPIQSSGIDFSMLTDQTQPILYFDDINLYEDDMHDNGYVSLRCKIRVMPSCFFILLSLFIRVDHVVIRLKESRFFLSFHQRLDGLKVIYRDVVWRECKWDSLAKHGLPTHAKMWRFEDEGESGHNYNVQQQRLQEMCKKLPVIDLPDGLSQHGSFSLNSRESL